jgi:hypothetical protein
MCAEMMKEKSGLLIAERRGLEYGSFNFQLSDFMRFIKTYNIPLELDHNTDSGIYYIRRLSSGN